MTVNSLAFTPKTYPKDKLAMSMFSDKILVVDIEAVKKTGPVVKNDIEWSSIQVTGTVVEVLRGKEKNPKFKGEGFLLKPTAKTKSSEGVVLHEITRFTKHESGILDCEKGRRFVVVYWADQEFYIAITKDDESWRKRISPKKDR